MPTYEVDVQGKTYEVDAPDENTAWQWANYTHTRAPAPTKSAGFSLANTALGLGQGVIGAGKSLTDVFGADNAVSAALGRGQSALGEMKTPERQAEQAARQAKIKAAEGTGFLNEVGAELGAVVEAPIESTAQAVGSVVPYLVTGLVGGAAKLLPATVKIINTIVGAAQGAGSIKGSIYDAVYERLKGTMPEAKAREQAAIAQEYNKENALDIAGGTILGAAGARFGVEDQLAKLGTKKALGKAVLGEAPMEGAQGGQEKIAQNRALQRAGFDVDTFQGAAGRAAGDAALGALAAGSVSAVQGSGAQARPTSKVSPTVDTEPTTETTTPVAEAPATYGTMWQAREQLRQEPQTPEVKAAIAELSAKMDAINVADVEAQTKRPFPAAGDEAKAKQSAFNLPIEGAQMEMASVGTTDQLPPEVDANGNPLNRFVGPDKDVGLGDVIAAELPPTTEVLTDAGIAPTQAELEAAGQQRLDMATPTPITEAEVTAFGASMSKPNRQWLADNVLGKTPDQIQMEIAYNRLVVPNNKGLQKVIKEIVANVTPKEPQNAPSTQPTVQQTPRARGRKPSVDVSVPPTADNAAAPGAGAPTGQPAGPVGQRLVPPEQPTTTGTKQQGIKPPTLKRRVEVDTAEIARQQEAAAIAAQLAVQAQASALGKPAPEQRTVVPDRGQREQQRKMPTKTQIAGALNEVIKSPRFTENVKNDARRHLRDITENGDPETSIEPAFNFLTEQAKKPRFLRTETPAAPMSHDKVKAVVAGIVAKLKNAPEVIVVRDMNDAAVPQAVRDHNNEQLAGGAKGSPAGFYHDGKVFIVSGQVNSAADVMTTFAHEALGHFGLRGVFGAALDTELKAIETTYKAEMEAVAAKYGLDLSDPKQASEAAEEVLANLAQTKPTLGIVQRAVAAIRAFIRKIMPSLQMTNNDIIAKFILPARAFVESGGSAVAADGGTRFSRAGIDAKDILQRMGRTAPVEDSRPMLQRVTDTVMGSVKANTPKEGAITRVLNMAEDALDVAAPLQRAIRDEVRASMPDSDANRLLAALSTSQAFHDSGLATTALLDGGIKYDPKSSKFKTSESKDNLKSIGAAYRSMMDTHGLTLGEARYFTSTALESKRMLALYAMRDSMMAEADAKELEGKKKIAASLRDKAESYVFHMTREQVKEGMKLFNTLPEIKKVEDIKQGMRKWLRTFLQETGIWSEETGQWMLDNAEWVPFQRDSTDADTDKDGFNAYIRGLQAKAKEHQFKGSMLAVHDVMDNFESWAAYSVARGIKNQKAAELAQAAVKYIPGQAKAVVTPDPRAADRTVSYLEKGSSKYVEFDSAAKAQVFKGAPVMATSALPFIGGFVDSLNRVFRGAIVNFPLFPVYQLAMDSMAATYLSGLKPRYAFQIPLTAVSEAVKNIRGMSAAHRELRTFGVVGVQDYDASLSKSNADVKAGLRKLGALEKYPAIMQQLNLTADNAVRQAVYLAAKDSGLSEADAVERAFEIINFRTRVGNNNLAAAARNVVFLNAFYAASRVALKVLKSEGIAPTARAEARNTLLTNMAWIFGMSVINAMMNVGDDEYEKMSRQEQASKLTLPGMHGWGIPLRPDVFLLPKYIAEAIVRQSSDKYADDPAKLRAGLSDAVVNAVFSGPVPVGQPIKLAVELATNYNFFTGRPIVGTGLDKLEPYMQYSAGTSSLAKNIGRGAKDLVDAMGMEGKGLSPAKIDAFIQGTMGMYGAAAILMTNALANNTPTQSMRDTIASLPGMGRVAVKEFDSQVKTDFYDLASKVNMAVDTANKMKSTGQGAEYREYVKENKDLIKYGPFVRKMEQQLGVLRKTMARINARTDLTKDQKEARLRTYKLSEQRMMNNLAPALKKYRTEALQ
jgi:hypothetical protein